MDSLSVAGCVSLLLLFNAVVVYRLTEHWQNPVALIVTVLGFTLAFSTVGVVPYDVSYALSGGNGKDQIAEKLLHKSWSVIYWTTFVMASFFCPVLVEYEGSGEFTKYRRLMNALRRYVVIYTVYFVIGVALLVWLVATGRVANTRRFEAWCIAVSNAWGLLVLTLLLGYGLVAVPRKLWRLANPEKQLTSLYAQTVAQDEQRLSKLFDLQDVIEQARMEMQFQKTSEVGCNTVENRQVILTFSDTLRRCENRHQKLTGVFTSSSLMAMESRPSTGGILPVSTRVLLGKRSPTDDEELKSPSSAAMSYNSVSPDNLHPFRRPFSRSNGNNQLEQLALLHKNLKVAMLEARRAATQWDCHVQNCMFYEDLQEQLYKSASARLFVSTSGTVFDGWCAHANTVARLCWHKFLTTWLKTVRKYFWKSASVFCGGLSAVIILGQMTMFRKSESYSLSLLGYVFEADRGPVLTPVLCFIPLGYMACASYYSIFRLRVPGWYGIYTNHNTDMGSIVWCSCILARLAAPLCHHVLKLIKVEGTTFQSFYNRMDEIGAIGAAFTDIFPCLIALVCFLNYINALSRVVACLSMGFIGFDNVVAGDGEDPRVEGQKIIQRERRRRAAYLLTKTPDVEQTVHEQLSAPLPVPAG